MEFFGIVGDQAYSEQQKAAWEQRASENSAPFLRPQNCYKFVYSATVRLACLKETRTKLCRQRSHFAPHRRQCYLCPTLPTKQQCSYKSHKSVRPQGGVL